MNNEVQWSQGRNEGIAMEGIERIGNGVYRLGDVRIADHAGFKSMPIGNDDFPSLIERGVFVDKTPFIRDLLANASKASLFCRPRRFGKSLSMSMLRAFLELPREGDEPPAHLFEGLSIWDADDGRWRNELGTRPVVYLNLSSAKGASWEETRAAFAWIIAAEYARHGYLATSECLMPTERATVERIAARVADDVELMQSLAALVSYLERHHRRQVVVLIDEYDVPVMAGYDHGYYDEIVSFMRTWLTGALKGNPGLDFAVLTGVQRIAKESIFSGLNNLKVSTPLSSGFNEPFGFTQAEVEALAVYTGHRGCMDELKSWYDGYRFGPADVYNPWSVLNYLDQGCSPDVYWGNTSSNDTVAGLIRRAGAETMGQMRDLLSPGGFIEARLDPAMVFPELETRTDALWSLLYLSGYVTTDDTDRPGMTSVVRRLRIPNREVAEVFHREVIERFSGIAGGDSSLRALHAALARGTASEVEASLADILLHGASCFDLVSENSYHMLLWGLCHGVAGYGWPLSNREEGAGRYDIRLMPERRGADLPCITIEVKMLARDKAPADKASLTEALRDLSQEALGQIGKRRYDAEAPENMLRVRYGIAFAGKRVAVEGARV